MRNLKPYSSSFIALAGFLLMGMGVYFIFLRPSLLPEDLRYMNIALPNLKETSFHMRTRGVFTSVAIAGISSIGLMTGINFLIDSDFKWILLTFMLPWVIALTLYRLHK